MAQRMACSPFPGMDPYLESSDLWPDVHESLMTILREQLTPLLVPDYIAEIGTQVVVERGADESSLTILPDATVRRGDHTVEESSPPYAPMPVRVKLLMPGPIRIVTLYIRRRESQEVVTVIELLSPVNMRPGEGRREYLRKRESILENEVHLVEIDLLRSWQHMPVVGEIPDSAYRAIVSVAPQRPECDAWAFGIRDSLPVLPVPLLPPDPPVDLAMGQALQTAYQRARYDLRIDYHRPPNPPLEPEDAHWVQTLLADGC